jgi:hypothetical protein
VKKIDEGTSRRGEKTEARSGREKDRRAEETLEERKQLAEVEFPLGVHAPKKEKTRRRRGSA